MVVGSTDGPQEALGCVIYCFLMKLTDEKELVTPGPTDQRTDGRTDRRTPSYRDARTHLIICEQGFRILYNWSSISTL